jgi:hypothetical protein
MTIAALVLYAVAFVLQLAGAVLVIQDVLTSRRNIRAFNVGLDDADEMARSHEARADHAPTPGWAAATRLAARQIGPATVREREALTTWVRAQNDMSDRRRWTAVGLLLGGVVVGFVGSVVALFA